MRFITSLISTAALLFLANAQTNTTSGALEATTTSAVVSGTASLSPAQSSQAACLATCALTDPSCRAACVGVAVPTGNYAGQNATIACITDCNQGNGTAAENLAYENCLKDCVASASITTASTAEPTSAGTGGSGAGTTGGSGAQTTQASGTAAGAGSSSTSSASASASSKAAADNVRVGVSFLGLLGGFIALVAL